MLVMAMESALLKIHATALVDGLEINANILLVVDLHAMESCQQIQAFAISRMEPA